MASDIFDFKDQALNFGGIQLPITNVEAEETEEAEEKRLASYKPLKDQRREFARLRRKQYTDNFRTRTGIDVDDNKIWRTVGSFIEQDKANSNWFTRVRSPRTQIKHDLSLRKSLGLSEGQFKKVRSFYKEYKSKERDFLKTYSDRDFKLERNSLNSSQAASDVAQAYLNSGLEALSFNSLAIKHPIHDRRVERIHPIASAGGSITGNVLGFMMLNQVAGTLGIANKIRSVADKSKFAKSILWGFGKPVEIMQKMSKIMQVAPLLGKLVKPATKLATAIGDDVLALGAGGLTSAGIGAFSEGLRIISDRFIREDKMSPDEWASQIPARLVGGFFQKYFTRVINVPKDWGTRFLGDAVFALGEQSYKVATGLNDNFNTLDFFQSMIQGHLLGEVQGAVFAPTREQANVMKKTDGVMNYANKFVDKNKGTSPEDHFIVANGLYQGELRHIEEKGKPYTAKQRANIVDKADQVMDRFELMNTIKNPDTLRITQADLDKIQDQAQRYIYLKAQKEWKLTDRERMQWQRENVLETNEKLKVALQKSESFKNKHKETVKEEDFTQVKKALDQIPRMDYDDFYNWLSFTLKDSLKLDADDPVNLLLDKANVRKATVDDDIQTGIKESEFNKEVDADEKAIDTQIGKAYETEYKKFLGQAMNLTNGDEDLSLEIVQTAFLRALETPLAQKQSWEDINKVLSTIVQRTAFDEFDKARKERVAQEFGGEEAISKQAVREREKISRTEAGARLSGKGAASLDAKLGREEDSQDLSSSLSDPKFTYNVEGQMESSFHPSSVYTVARNYVDQSTRKVPTLKKMVHWLLSDIHRYTPAEILTAMKRVNFPGAAEDIESYKSNKPRVSSRIGSSRNNAKKEMRQVALGLAKQKVQRDKVEFNDPEINRRREKILNESLPINKLTGLRSDVAEDKYFQSKLKNDGAIMINLGFFDSLVRQHGEGPASQAVQKAAILIGREIKGLNEEYRLRDRGSRKRRIFLKNPDTNNSTNFVLYKEGLSNKEFIRVANYLKNILTRNYSKATDPEKRYAVVIERPDGTKSVLTNFKDVSMGAVKGTLQDSARNLRRYNNVIKMARLTNENNKFYDVLFYRSANKEMNNFMDDIGKVFNLDRDYSRSDMINQLKALDDQSIKSISDNIEQMTLRADVLPLVKPETKRAHEQKLEDLDDRETTDPAFENRIREANEPTLFETPLGKSIEKNIDDEVAVAMMGGEKSMVDDMKGIIGDMREALLNKLSVFKDAGDDPKNIGAIQAIFKLANSIEKGTFDTSDFISYIFRDFSNLKYSSDQMEAFNRMGNWLIENEYKTLFNPDTNEPILGAEALREPMKWSDDRTELVDKLKEDPEKINYKQNAYLLASRQGNEPVFSKFLVQKMGIDAQDLMDVVQRLHKFWYNPLNKEIQKNVDKNINYFENVKDVIQKEAKKIMTDFANINQGADKTNKFVEDPNDIVTVNSLWREYRKLVEQKVTIGALQSVTPRDRRALDSINRQIDRNMRRLLSTGSKEEDFNAREQRISSELMENRASEDPDTQRISASLRSSQADLQQRRTGLPTAPNKGFDIRAIDFQDYTPAEIKAFTDQIRSPEMKERAETLTRWFYDIDPHELSYVRHAVLGKEANKKKFLGVINSFAKRGRVRGKELADPFLKEFTGRKIPTLAELVKAGYIINDDFVTDLASSMKYYFMKKSNDRMSSLFKKQFLGQFKVFFDTFNQSGNTDDMIEFFREKVGGYFYMPTSSDFKKIELQVERLENRIDFLETRGQSPQDRAEQIQLGAERSELQNRLVTMRNLISVLSGDIPQFKNDKDSREDFQEKVKTALIADGVYKPANSKSFRLDKQKGVDLIKESIITKQTKNSDRAADLHNFDGLYFNDLIWNGMKQYVYRDDSLDNKHQENITKKFFKTYDKANTFLKLIRFYKPTIILGNDMVQASLANPAWVKNVNFAVKAFNNKNTKTTDTKDLPPDQQKLTDEADFYQLMMKNNLFNKAVSMDPILDEMGKSVNKILGRGGVWDEVGRAIGESKGIGKALATGSGFFKLSQGVTWGLDEMMRISTAKPMFDRFTKAGHDRNTSAYLAAKWTNLFMVEYSRIPHQTRRWLNRVGLVLTYRIQTLRMYKEMAKMAGKGALRMSGMNPQSKLGRKLLKNIFKVSDDPKVQARFEIGPLFRAIIGKGMVKGMASLLFGFGYDNWWDAVSSYRTKRKKGDGIVDQELQFLSFGTPLFDIEKILSRPLKVTLKYNAAAMPGLILSVVTNKNIVTGEKVIKVDPKKQPAKAVGQFVADKIRTYFPFGQDLPNFLDKDKNLIQKLLNFSGMGFFYKAQSPKELLNDFRVSMDESRTIAERDKAWKQFRFKFGRAYEVLFDEKYKNIVDSLEGARDETRGREL